jgi:DNA-binding winged helix-turn-helix (wHTH) protein
MKVKFGEYEFCRASLTLVRAGRRVKLTGQPLQLLVLLLERPGHVVTRDTIRQRLWPDTHVDFDHSLNVALNRLRLALGDRSKGSPIVETIPRVGYRFALIVEDVGAVPVRTPKTVLRRVGWYAAVAVGAALLALMLVRQHYDKLVDRPVPDDHAASADARKR